MSTIDYQKIRDNSARIKTLADEIAKVLDKAGLAQRQGSYLDSRCEKIKELSHEMAVAAGASTP